MSAILKGGRITGTKSDVVKFISSIDVDRKIAHSTILVNEAHVIALAKAKVILRKDCLKLLRALQKLERRVTYPENLEDVHVLIEEYVTRETGRETGGLLHIGKSRNDQVATAIRMSLRNELLIISKSILTLERVILQMAGKHTRSVFPGYTHLQPAQPITFAHYLISVGDPILRDNDRLLQAFDRVNKSPMGAAALAGTSFKIDRGLVARLLGFRGLVENSLDAVGSRDFLIESLSIFSMIALSLSRIAQDIIFYSCADVGLLEIPDSFSSTSSIMPQKKNPDPVELLRAKCARIVANYFSAATIMHGLPSGYNLDFQEITPLAWESADSLKSCLNIITQLIPKLKPNKNRANDTLELTTATEITNILVRNEKLPFRMAHQAVGKAVRMALAGRVMLSDLQVGDWETALSRRVTRKTMTAIQRALIPQQQIHVYRTIGSPNPKLTKQMIQRRATIVKSLIKRTFKAQAAIMSSYKQLSTYQRLLSSSKL